MDRNFLKLPIIPDYDGGDKPIRKKIEIKIVDDNNQPIANQVENQPKTGTGTTAGLRKSRTSIVSLAQHQLKRRESALSLFSLTASSEQKRIGIDYLNKLYEEKLRDQDEYSSLLRESSKLVAAQKQANRTPSGSFCFVSNADYVRRLSVNTPTLAQSTSQLLAREELKSKRAHEVNPVNSLTFFSLFLILLRSIVIVLLRAGFISKRVVNNLRQNLKIYLFILFLFSVIGAAILFSLFKLFNKIKNRV